MPLIGAMTDDYEHERTRASLSFAIASIDLWWRSSEMLKAMWTEIKIVVDIRRRPQLVAAQLRHHVR